MRTLEKKYSRTERIVAKAKFSCWVYMWAVALAVLLGGIIAALWVFRAQIEGLFGNEQVKILTDANLRWALLGAAGVVLLTVLGISISLYSRELIVTEDKVVYRKGVAAVTNIVIPLSEIRIVETEQNGIQRVFGVGAVTIISDAVQPYRIKGVKGADRLTRRLMRQLGDARKESEGRRMQLQLASRPVPHK